MQKNGQNGLFWLCNGFQPKIDIFTYGGAVYSAVSQISAEGSHIWRKWHKPESTESMCFRKISAYRTIMSIFNCRIYFNQNYILLIRKTMLNIGTLKNMLQEHFLRTYILQYNMD